MTIEIQSARALQKGPDDKLPIQYTDKGTIKVPRAEIDNAFFQIDDLLNMKTAAGGGGPASDLDFGPDWDLFDQLDGHVNFTAEPFVKGFFAGTAVYEAGPFKIKVPINKGKVNFANVEDESTGKLADV